MAGATLMNQNGLAYVAQAAPRTMITGTGATSAQTLDVSSFGKGGAIPYQSDMYSQTPYQTYTLGESMSAQQILLTVPDNLIRSIETEMIDAMLAYVLPIRKFEDFHWVIQRKRFNPALMTIVPYHGISNLLTTSRELRSGETERFGCAFEMENDYFQHNPRGKQDFLDNVEHVKRTALSTMYMCAVNELVSALNVRAEWIKQHNYLKESPELFAKFEQSEWGCMQHAHDPQQFGKIVDEEEHSMQLCGAQPADCVIVSARWKSAFAMQQPVKLTYEIIGPDGKPYMMQGPDALAQIGKRKIYGLQEVPYDPERKPFDPLSSTSMIGQYYCMYCRLSDEGLKTYTSDTMTIFIHDETADAKVPITLRDMVRNCMRWDDETGELRGEHERLAELANDPHTPEGKAFAEEKRSLDWALYQSAIDGQYRVVNLLGQIEKQFLSGTDLKNMVQTVVNQVAGREGMIDEALAGLRNLVIASDTAPISTQYMAEFAALNAKYVPVSAAVPDALDPTPLPLAGCNPFGGLDIPTSDAALADIMRVPPGLNTYGMLKTFASLHCPRFERQIEIARAGIEAVELVADLIGRVVPDSKINDAENLPVWLREFAGTDPSTIRRWAVCSQLVGAQLATFMKLLNWSRGESAAPAQEAALLDKLSIANKIAAISDLFCTVDIAAAPTPLLAIANGNAPLTRMGANGVKTLFVLPEMIWDAESLAEKEAKGIVKEFGKGLDGPTSAAVVNNLRRLIARLYLNDLIVAGNKRPDVVKGLPIDQLTQKATFDSLPRSCDVYIKEGWAAHEMSQHFADVIKNLRTAITSGDATANLQDLAGQVVPGTLQTLTQTQRYDIGAEDITAVGAAPNDPRYIAQIIVGNLTVAVSKSFGTGDGSWVKTPDADAASYSKSADMDLVVSALKNATADWTGDQKKAANLKNGIDYTGTNYVVVTQLQNASIGGGAMALAGKAIPAKTLSKDVIRTMNRLVLSGQLGVTTTLNALFAGYNVEPVTGSVYSAMPWYRVPIGCGKELANMFATSTNPLGGKPYLYPCDPASNCMAPIGLGQTAASRVLVQDLEMLMARTGCIPGHIMGDRRIAMRHTAVHAAYIPYGGEAVAAAGPEDVLATHVRTVARVMRDYESSFMGSELRRLLAISLFLMPVTLRSVMTLIEENVLPVWLGFVAARAFMTFLTHAVVVMKEGLDTGVTFLSFDNFHVGRAVSVGTLRAEYRVHVKTVIVAPENVGIIRNASIDQTLSGMGTKFIVNGSDAPLTTAINQKDILCMCGSQKQVAIKKSADPFGPSRCMPNPFSLTGSYAQLGEGFGRESDHYAVGFEHYYRQVWPDIMGRITTETIQNGAAYTGQNQLNGICYRGNWQYYNEGRGDFTGHEPNTGHFKRGDTVPGTARIRDGTELYYSLTPEEITKGLSSK